MNVKLFDVIVGHLSNVSSMYDFSDARRSTWDAQIPTRYLIVRDEDY